MGATVDSLEIQIQSQANKANASIDSLIKKLGRLNSSLSSVNSRGFSTMASGVNKLANATQNFSRNTSKDDFSRLARELRKLNNVDTSNISKVAGSLKTLASGLSAVNGITFNAQGLNSLINSLRQLGSIKGTSGVNNLSKLKNDLAGFVQGINSIGAVTFDATNLLKLVNTITRLGGKTGNSATQNLPKISAQLQNFVRQMNQIGSLSFDPSSLATLVKSITQLGGKNSTAAIANIPRLATALQNLMITLSRAPAVSQNLIQMTNALAALSRSGASTGRAANSISNSLNKVSKSSLGLKRGLFGSVGGLRSFATQLLAAAGIYVGIYGAIRGIKASIDIASDLVEVQNVVDATFGDMSYKVEELAQNSIKQFGMSELSLKQYASRFQAMGVAMGISNSSIQKSNEYLNKQTDGYVGLSDSMSDVSLNLTKLTADMASFYNVSQSDVAEDLSAIFTGQTRPLRTYGLDLTQATLQEWAMKQGIDADIQSMSQAEKTMLRYQYVMANTTVAQGDFARTSNTWANQVRILVEQFKQFGKVIGTGLIAAFKPFLQGMNVVMAKVISFTETVLNALGQIFGWKFEISGGGYTNDLADDMEDAAIGAGDLSDNLGSAAKNAEKLSTLGIDELNVISQNSDNSSGGGSGNGGSGAGSSDGNGITTKMTRSDTMLQAYKSSIDSLYELGEYISDTLSKTLEGINWNSVYKKAENFGTGLAEFLNGLISPRLFENVGITIAGSLNTAFHAANAFAIEFDWSNLGQSLAKSLKGFFTNWDAELRGETFSNFVNGILESITKFLDTIGEDDVFYDIGQKLVDFICGIDWKTLVWNLTGFASGLLNAMVEFPLDVARGIAQTIVNKIFGTEDVKIETPEWINDIFGFLIASLTPAAKMMYVLPKAGDIAKSFAEIASAIKEGYENIVSSLWEWAIGRWSDLKSFLIGIPGFFKELGETAVSMFLFAWMKIGEWAEDRCEAFKNGFSTAKDYFKTLGLTTYEMLKIAWASVGDWAKQKWESIKSPFKDAKQWFKDAFQSAYNAVTSIWKAIGGFFKGIAQDIVDPIGKAVNGVIDGINWIFNKVSGKKPLTPWTVPKFASGSNGLQKDTIGMVNDQPGSTYKELIVPPNGKPFIPNGRNVMLPMEKGTKIMPANQTKAFMGSIPKFAGGIGDFFGGIWEKVTSFTGNVLDYLTDPKKIVQIAIDKFTDFTGVGSFFMPLASGAISKVLDSVVEYIKKLFDDITTVNYSPSAGVEQWRQLARKALEMTGQYTAGNLNLLLYQMQTESGGNPNAINLWDINAKNGIPSKGLMQVIDPTFRAYAYPGYGTNIYDPLSNMLAAIRYTLARYGSLSKGWKGHGYAGGAGKITLADIIPAYSVGGFPEDGLFMANHDEIVGKFDNGRNVVMNNNQIIQSVSAGVEAAFERQNAKTNALLTKVVEYQKLLLDKDTSVNIDGKKADKQLTKARRNSGYSFSPA